MKKINVKIKGIKFHLKPYKKKFIKFFRNIFFLRRIIRCKNFSKNVHLEKDEKLICKYLNKKGYAKLPSSFFSVNEIKELGRYKDYLLKIKTKEIEKILNYKNIRAINKEFFYQSDHILYKLMTNSKIIKIVSKYLGMHPHFWRADIVVSRNIISSLKGSQLWHTDQEDNRVVKLFIYLSDVLDDEYGPFILSEKNEKNTQLFRKKLKAGHWHDQQLEKMNINLKPISILGSFGTSFIVDTALNPHKGSIKLKKDRVIFVATYLTHSHWQPYRNNLKYNYELIS